MYCMSGIVGNGPNGKMVIGATFLRAYYSVYTYDLPTGNAWVSLAPAALDAGGDSEGAVIKQDAKQQGAPVNATSVYVTASRAEIADRAATAAAASAVAGNLTAGLAAPPAVAVSQMAGIAASTAAAGGRSAAGAGAALAVPPAASVYGSWGPVTGGQATVAKPAMLAPAPSRAPVSDALTWSSAAISTGKEATASAHGLPAAGAPAPGPAKAATVPSAAPAPAPQPRSRPMGAAATAYLRDTTSEDAGSPIWAQAVAPSASVTAIRSFGAMLNGRKLRL